MAEGDYRRGGAIMRRSLILACLLALGLAFSCNGDDDDGGSHYPVPLLRGPVSEMAGISTHLRPGGSAAELARRAYQFERLQAAGIKYVRNEFLWHRIEPSQGAFDYSGHDVVVAEAVAHGEEIIGLLSYGAPWAAADSGGSNKYPPDDPADYAHFVYTTVDRYKDSVHYWEIWNEQNAQRFWKPDVDPEGYGELLKAASVGIRTADPDALVVFGGMAPIYSADWEHMWGFLEEVYAFHPDVGDYFDVLAIHTYTWIQVAEPETDSPINPLQQSVTGMIEDAREVMLRWEGRARPIWITEVGWYTAINDPLGYVTEEDQARYLVRSFILSVAGGADMHCWYTFDDGSNYLDDSEAAFGLVGYDPDPTDDNLPTLKPAYHAHDTLTATLGDTYYSADLRAALGLPDNQYAFRFVAPGGSKVVTVLWSLEEDLSVVLLRPWPGMAARYQVEMLGATSELSPSHGYLPVIVSNSPTYLVEER